MNVADPARTNKLGPEHRNRKWKDSEGWTFEWSGDTFWHIYTPAGTLADDQIEEALNEMYKDSPYRPFVEILK